MCTTSIATQAAIELAGDPLEYTTDIDVEEACPEHMLLDGDCNSDDDIDVDCI